MTGSNQTTYFNGKCAPFIYIAGCSKVDQDAYVLESRIWLPILGVCFIFMIAAIIRRCTIVKESFNTLRMILILFTIGLVGYVFACTGWQDEFNYFSAVTLRPFYG
jgi:predicted membrane channel-forming protein YqfA (hemolysin III family)